MLILEHNKSKPAKGKDNKNSVFWSFCKGHKEGEESDVQTAIRELREEADLEVRRLWMEEETWQEFCTAVCSATDGSESQEGLSDPTGNPRTFVERYPVDNNKFRRQVQKEVRFFVAMIEASEEDVDVTKSKGEITHYKWVPLQSTRNEVETLTDMFREDLYLFERIKQAILGDDLV
ncbi:hypothetical protein V7S43_006627 [Phytophthora oleae]|uniref:Nudix hydrolase domain-containing protein n=1 Tax=Phytophthora oleae TaxID=2107226 RepID=A0ABD3FSD3_9STRA